jgi:hypothetical protein
MYEANVVSWRAIRYEPVSRSCSGTVPYHLRLDSSALLVP